MAILLSIGAILGCILLAVTLLSQVEVFRQLRAVRSRLDLDGRGVPLGLAAIGRQFELTPTLDAFLDSASATYLLAVHARCTTCLAIARELSGQLPSIARFVVDHNDVSPGAGLDFLMESPTEVILDEEDRIFEALSLNIAPALLGFEYRTLVTAVAVSTPGDVRAALSDSGERAQRLMKVGE